MKVGIVVPYSWSTTPPPNDHEYGTTMPTFIRARLPASCEEQTDHGSGDHELRVRGDPAGMASAATVEELLAAGPKPGHDVLEVRHRGSRAAEHGGVEEPAPRREQAERHETAADLEAPVGDVLVRHLVARDVQGRTKHDGKRPRADERTQSGAGCDVQRDDHIPMIAYALGR